jgi:hypothetical protein
VWVRKPARCCDGHHMHEIPTCKGGTPIGAMHLREWSRALAVAHPRRSKDVQGVSSSSGFQMAHALGRRKTVAAIGVPRCARD